MNTLKTAQYHTRSLALRDVRERFASYLIGVFILLFISYIYIVGSITFNVAARKNIAEVYSVSASKIGELELRYLALSNDLTLEKAREYGFKEAVDPVFVRSSASTASLVSSEHDL